MRGNNHSKNGPINNPNDGINLFKDPVEVPRLREIMYGEGMKFNDDFDIDNNQNNKQQRENVKQRISNKNDNSLDYSPQNVGYSKKKKYLEFLGHNILNPMPQPSMDEISKNQRFKSYDSPDRKRKNKIQDQNDKQIKDMIQSSLSNKSYNENDLDRDFLKTPILETDHNPNPLIYERIKSELKYNQRNNKNEDFQFNKSGDKDKQEQRKDIDKGFDKQNAYKRNQRDVSISPDAQYGDKKRIQANGRFTANNPYNRKDQVANLLTHDYVN